MIYTDLEPNCERACPTLLNHTKPITGSMPILWWAQRIGLLDFDLIQPSLVIHACICVNGDQRGFMQEHDIIDVSINGMIAVLSSAVSMGTPMLPATAAILVLCITDAVDVAARLHVMAEKERKYCLLH